ncbi:hypothetical protein ZYGR_0U00690 [Zygosaccharomyces rouxii]|uniref:Peptidase A1 domain-containing protein n=1 Tax=Zygosaccharomyces rouxii TaxID=4956 RepID=A0A1Q3A3L0_ZYGRO|nr:hypothetical protein ZYGR_0U00690 [Zygosaccharomyces rouxii]
MRFTDAVVSLLSVASTCKSALIEQTSSPMVKLSFNKWHGPTYEESSLERRSLETRNNKEFNFIVENQQNFYSVDLLVGTPGQNITVLLDTGSSDLWLTAKNNPYCKSNAGSNDKKEDYRLEDGDNQSIVSMLTASGTGTNPIGGSGIPTAISGSAQLTGTYTSGTGTGPSGSSPEPTMDCSQYGTFDVNKSKSFRSNKTEFYISYGDGSFASGYWGTDSVNFANMNLDGVSFAVANETNSTVGVFGIGLPENEATYTPDPSLNDFHPYEYQNFPQVLKSKGAINKAAYSLFLNSLDASSGDILFGAVDRSKYKGDLYTLPLLNSDPTKYKNPMEFDVTLQGVGFTNGSSKTTFTTTKIPALLDSGTSLIYLPDALAKGIAHKLGGSYNEDIGYYVIGCPSENDDSQLVFDFGGFTIKNNLSNYLLGSPDDGDDSQCVLGILPSDVQAILGDVFLADAYVVYDLDDYEVSLAQASFDNSKEDIQIISDSIPGAKRAPGYSKTWSTPASIKSGGNIFTSSNKKTERDHTAATATPVSGSASSTSGAQISSQDVANGFSPSMLALLNAFILSFVI